MDGSPRTRGRPRGQDYGLVRSLRFAATDVKLLAALARRWGCSEAAAVRRLIREEATRLELEAMDLSP